MVEAQKSDKQSNCKSTSERQSNLLFVCFSILGKKYFYLFYLFYTVCSWGLPASVLKRERIAVG